jgi:starch synthase (maltosyl-transferring)
MSDSRVARGGAPGRFRIDGVEPLVELGRHPAKAVVGERVSVGATVWREGHAALGASVVWRGPDGRLLPPGPMRLVDAGLDRWEAEFVPDRQGCWSFRVEAWDDPWTSWVHRVRAKLDAGLPTASLENDLLTGAELLLRLASPHEQQRDALREAARTLADTGRSLNARVAPALGPEVASVTGSRPLRALLTRGDWYRLDVERPRALFGSWYEFFPRSTGGVGEDATPRHGTFATAAAELPRIARMGFDVVYLPPVHPIGRLRRKGPNNALVAGPGDVGSPWAIGAREGGHDAVHPALGTIEDFDAFVAAAGRHGLEVALDLALQCAPDHPWITEHPEWFTRQPDGTLAHAENPPKIYQDIHPLDFDNDPEGLYQAVLGIVEHWVAHGVRIFRVDNPHTKPAAFWERLIAEVRGREPDVLFLAEAFTRPAVLKGLARLGFSQSYTYFTWRTGKDELESYLTELVGQARSLRPNFFVNTPDILPEHLQHGGPRMFALRAALAALLSPTWGVYSGFELFEHRAVRPGAEEYLDSEKYELRPRDYARAARQGRSLEPWITALNTVRRRHPALRQLNTLRFLEVDNDALLAFVKSDPATGDRVLCVVTLDPERVERGVVLLGPESGPVGVTVRDELSGETVEVADKFEVTIDPFRAVAMALVLPGAALPVR